MVATARRESYAIPKGDLESSPQPMSQVLWGIQWASHLPMSVGNGVEVSLSSLEDGLDFIHRNYTTIFELDPTSRLFVEEPMDAAKTRYMQSHADFFSYNENGAMVGLLVCTVHDWSTYYIRSAATLPRLRGSKILRTFFPAMFDVLRKAGVRRVEAETAPSNLAVVELLNSQGFNISGTALSERWGALTRFTKFLDDDCAEHFLTQFCVGVRYQQKR